MPSHFNPKDTQTYNISISGAASQDVFAAEPGVRWAILFIAITHSAATVLTFDSGTTAVGSMRLPSSGGSTDPHPFGDGATIIMQARAANEKLNIESTNGEVAGWVQIVRLRGID